MRLVVDTNTLVSGSLWQGPSARLISAALAGRVRIFCSLPLLLELQETLQLPKFGGRLAGCGETAESLTEHFRAVCHETIPAAIAPPDELRDPDDFHVLACAVAARADAIVTGDNDLLSLKAFQGIPILKVRDVLEKLGIPAE